MYVIYSYIFFTAGFEARGFSFENKYRENKDKLSIGVKLLSNEEKARQTNMLKLRQSWDNNY